MKKCGFKFYFIFLHQFFFKSVDLFEIQFKKNNIFYKNISKFSYRAFHFHLKHDKLMYLLIFHSFCNNFPIINEDCFFLFQCTFFQLFCKEINYKKRREMRHDRIKQIAMPKNFLDHHNGNSTLLTPSSSSHTHLLSILNFHP